MSRKYDIISIGVAILDSIIAGFDPSPVSPAGYRAESCTLSAGGDAVNEAIAASKLGLNAAILCYLGNDPAGDIIMETLEANGVSTDLIIRSDDHPTPVTTIFVREDGNRRSITNQAHNYNFHPEQYSDIFRDTKAIILGSLFRAPFNDPEIIHSIVSEARANDVLIFADTKMPNFRRLSLEDISDSLPLIDYITPNEDEAAFYTGQDSPESMADALIRLGSRNVIIKRGADGCYFRSIEKDAADISCDGVEEHDRGISLSVPAFNLGTVDATGAGDNFIAGFASEILRGSDTGSALRFANACGAICTTAVGAGTALKDWAQVLCVLQQ